MRALPISPLYRDAVRVALLLQVPLTFFFALLLDGGLTAKIAGCAMAGFWAGVAVMMLRRPKNPGTWDLNCIRYGYVIVFLVALRLAFLIPRLHR